MNDLHLLILALGILYLWECACWIRRGSLALRTAWGRHWRVVVPGSVLGNARGAFIFAPPLPPLGNLVATHFLPVSLSPHAILAFVPCGLDPAWRASQSGRCLAWAQIQTVTVRGRKVLVNGSVFLKAASMAHAIFLARAIDALRALPEPDRAAAVCQLFRESLDAKAVRKRWRRLAGRLMPMRVLANTLFIYLLVFVPAWVLAFGLKNYWPLLLALLLGLTTAIALSFRRLHRSFHPGADDERLTHFLVILLSPLAAIRAQETLTRSLLENFHPLAVLHEFLDAPDFAGFARRQWMDLNFPMLPACPVSGADAEDVERFSREQWRDAVGDFLRRQGLHPEEWGKAPAPADEACRSYCPRCEAQFIVEEGKCADCGYALKLLKVEG